MPAAAADLSHLLAQSLRERQLQLPVLPQVAADVLSLTQLDSTDAARLSAVIHGDQTLASNVLRVANSAEHAASAPIVSLQQAVSRLGLQLVSELALAVSVQGSVFAAPRTAELLRHLWQHSVLVGFYTKEIARLRRRNVEIAFLCGLLHDVGKAVLLAQLDRELPTAKVELGDIAVALHELHGEAGAVLASRWRLPEPIAETITCHHGHQDAGRFQELAAMVALADLLAHQLAAGGTGPESPSLHGHPLLATLNLYQDQLSALLDKRDAALQLAARLR